MKISSIPSGRALPKYLAFPSSMRIGTDICRIARIRKLVAKDHKAFARRVLTEGERVGHWKRLAVPELVPPITRDTGPLLPYRNLVFLGPTGGDAVDIFDGEGNYVLDVSEWKMIFGLISGLIQKNKLTSDLWSVISSQYSNAELEKIEGHEFMSDRELARKILELRNPYDETEGENLWELLRRRVYDGLDVSTELRDIEKAALELLGSKSPPLKAGEVRNSLSTEENEKKQKLRELEDKKKEELKERARLLGHYKYELESMAKNIREVREADKLTKREAAIKNAATFLSGRWAAKEAIVKAHNHRRITFHDIEIHTPPKNSSGTLPPIAFVKSEEGGEHPYREVQVSISHDGDYAIATALVCGPSPVNKQSSESTPFSSLVLDWLRGRG